MTVALATGWWIAGITVIWILIIAVIVALLADSKRANHKIEQDRQAAPPTASADTSAARDPRTPRFGKEPGA